MIKKELNSIADWLIKLPLFFKVLILLILVMSLVHPFVGVLVFAVWLFITKWIIPMSKSQDMQEKKNKEDMTIYYCNSIIYKIAVENASLLDIIQLHNMCEMDTRYGSVPNTCLIEYSFDKSKNINSDLSFVKNLFKKKIKECICTDISQGYYVCNQPTDDILKVIKVTEDNVSIHIFVALLCYRNTLEWLNHYRNINKSKMQNKENIKDGDF